MEHPGPFGEEGCFIYGTPLAFWRGHRVSPAKRPGLGRQTAAATPLPPSPHGPFRRSRAVFSRKPGLSRRISCRQKIAPIFRRQKIRGGWIPSGCGEPLRKPFSSLKAPYGCRGGRPSSPGPIRPCAAFPWLPTAITLLPPCAPGAFPRGLPRCPPGLSHRVSLRVLRGFPVGSPQAHAGFSLGILPPEGRRGRPMGFARTKPRRSNRPAILGIRPGLAGASQGLLPRPFPGSAWEGHGGMGVVAEETGGEQRWAARERRKPSRTV